jgi:hypothetical protein
MVYSGAWGKLIHEKNLKAAAEKKARLGHSVQRRRRRDEEEGKWRHKKGVMCAVCRVLCAVCRVLCAVCCVLCAVCRVLCAVCCVLCTYVNRREQDIELWLHHPLTAPKMAAPLNM